MSLQKKHKDFINTLLETNNITETCKKYNISRTTYYKWMKNTDFLYYLDNIQKLHYMDSVQHLKCSSAIAMDTCFDLLNSKDEKLRLRAANVILDNVSKYNNLTSNRRCAADILNRRFK